jgi:hypothetical protein
MKRYFLLFCLLAIPFSGGGAGAAAQDDASRIRVSVVLVQLNVAVTDNKGNYISGLKPEDFLPRTGTPSDVARCNCVR